VSKPDSFFRGSELPRLLVLLVILIGGMVLLWNYLYSQRMAGEPERVARVPIAPIVPDRSPEFETVQDKTEIRLRDMAAYRKLLEQADRSTPAELDARSRRDVLSIQIWERPDHYRGVPIHLLGTVLRVMTYESKLGRSGRLYEAWMVTSDSQRNPYVCVFEDAPLGFPIGDNLSERVVFNGYFLKLMKYQSGKDLGFYVSPVLIGRIGWSSAAPARREVLPGPYGWLAGALGLMFVVSLIRWMTGLRRSLSWRSRAAIPRDHPTDTIAPEDFAAWLETIPDDDADGPRDDPSRRGD
jgi:hypothetical protein